MKNKTILVTKPFLPNQQDYISWVSKIWENQWLTNDGPLTRELEEKLRNYLDVKHCLITSNGTIALQIALQALDITEGEVITTPFTYVATTTSILWERC